LRRKKVAKHISQKLVFGVMGLLLSVGSIALADAGTGYSYHSPFESLGGANRVSCSPADVNKALVQTEGLVQSVIELVGGKQCAISDKYEPALNKQLVIIGDMTAACLSGHQGDPDVRAALEDLYHAKQKIRNCRQ
jgi:hypothetical protein